MGWPRIRTLWGLNTVGLEPWHPKSLLLLLVNRRFLYPLTQGDLLPPLLDRLLPWHLLLHEVPLLGVWCLLHALTARTRRCR